MLFCGLGRCISRQLVHSRLSTFVVHHNRQHHHLGQLQLLQVHTAPRQQHNQQQQFVQHRMATKAAAAGGAADANLPPAEAAVAPSTSADDVRGALRELLPTVDMDSTTERKIREMLAVRLGADMEPFKKVIKEHIDNWLSENLAAAAAAAGGGGGGLGAAAEDDSDDDMMPPSSVAPLAARKRKAAAAAAGGAGAAAGAGVAGGERAAKVARRPPSGGFVGDGHGLGGGIDTTGAPDGGYQLDADGYKWLSVSEFKGVKRADLRNYYRNKSTGALAPTKKGISLNAAEWGALINAGEQVDQAVDREVEGVHIQLGGSKRVTTSIFRGQLHVDIREYYTDNSSGELKPGQKGMSLLPDQWAVVAHRAQDIAAALGPAAGRGQQQPAAAAAAAAAAAGGGGGGGAAAQPVAVLSPAVPPAVPAAAVPAAAAGGGGGGDVLLGGKKRAAVSTFTGSPCVDLRECYEKDGSLLPTKKGIFLKPDQWRAIVGAAADITTALDRQNTGYVLELGSKRRVTISEFKRVYYVGVREYYEQNGELKPGQKGLSMNKQQWQALVAGMDSLTAQLG